jgi:dolichol kinase
MDDTSPRDPLRQRAENLLQRLRLRRREPWNWLVQTLFAALLPPGLLFHSAPLIALSVLGMAAGCLPLPLPPMQHTEARRLAPLIEKLIGMECAWLAEPMTPRKKRQIILLALGGLLTAWFLWRQDLGPIGLAIAAWALYYIRRRNIEDGIDP